MNNVIHICDGKLAKRRTHNAFTIAKWVQQGCVEPRKEAALAGVLFVLRQNAVLLQGVD